jgi:hypothetical protein
MFRLDYVSCVLTIASTILVGEKRWEGWLVAGFNSICICIIAVNTSQTGFIPANLYCLALCGHNVRESRKGRRAPSAPDQEYDEAHSIAV